MRRTACILGLLALACNTSGPSATSFGTLPLTLGQADGSTGASSSTGGSTSSVPEDSTAGAASTAASTDTTLALDVGARLDIPPAPEGCRGKIDILFVISSHFNMEAVQVKLAASLPIFIEEIQDRFADFDYHIMVVDADPSWGNTDCNTDCAACVVPEYPCDLLDTVTQCDETIGAGTVFNAGRYTYNKPCPVAGGNRFLVKGQPDLPDTFLCLARVGIDGGAQLGEALASAVTPAKTAHCNKGFIRDDALLFVSIISYTTDWQSNGTPEEWAQAVLDAKHGDPDAVVMFSLFPISGTSWTDLESCADEYPHGDICEMMQFFPHRLLKDQALPHYGPAFKEAVDLVDEACSTFVPQ